LKWRENVNKRIEENDLSGFKSYLDRELADQKDRRLRTYVEAKLIMQGNLQIPPTKDHLLALYELFHLAAEEAIILGEQLDQMERSYGLRHKDPNND
jgi:hypothetical protein